VSVNLFVSHIRAVIAVTGFAIHTVIGVTKFANVAKQSSAARWLALGSLYFFDAMTGLAEIIGGRPRRMLGDPWCWQETAIFWFAARGSVHIKRRK
jgi:hypothetical protein